MILFEHVNFRGAHKPVFRAESALKASDDSYFNDQVSSIVVLEVTWAFFRNSNFNDQYARTLGPGQYPDARAADIQN